MRGSNFGDYAISDFSVHDTPSLMHSTRLWIRRWGLFYSLHSSPPSHVSYSGTFFNDVTTSSDLLYRNLALCILTCVTTLLFQFILKQWNSSSILGNCLRPVLPTWWCLRFRFLSQEDAWSRSNFSFVWIYRLNILLHAYLLGSPLSLWKRKRWGSMEEWRPQFYRNERLLL